MVFHRKGVWLLGALASVLAPLTVSAEQPDQYAAERSWYAGGVLGLASGEVSDGDMNERMAANGYDAHADVSNLDRMAYSVIAGYRWSRYVAFEGAYTDLGKVTTTLYGVAADVQDFIAGADRVHPVSADGLELSLHGRYPLTDRSVLFGRMGLMFADSRYEANASSGQRDRLSDESRLKIFGLGLDYSLSPRWTLRTGLSRYRFSSEDVDFLGLGVLYQFSTTEKRQPEPVIAAATAPAPEVMPDPVPAPVEVASAPIPVAAAAEPEPMPAPEPSLMEQLQGQGLATQQTDRGIVVTLTGVLFATNSAELNEAGLASVQKVATLLHAHPNRSLVVEGHTDSRGRAEANELLSERRADSVRQVMIASGIGDHRIIARGYGESYPVAANDTESGRQQNRRVEFLISDENGNPVPERR